MAANIIQYRGYIATIEFSQKKMMFYGKIAELEEKIVFEGKSPEDLVYQFYGIIDDYILKCKREGKSPKVIYRGSFNMRISPKLHEQLARYAIKHGISLNQCIEQILEKSEAAKEESENMEEADRRESNV